MDTIIPSVQALLEVIDEVNYVDEDWGQLDNYSPHPPVKWPCILIDIAAASFSELGQDRTATPMQRQIADTRISLTIANMKLTNSSGRAPQPQKDNAHSIHTLIKKVHEKLHGINPNATSGKLIRTGFQRVKRDDGIQEYTVIYSLDKTNV